MSVPRQPDHPATDNGDTRRVLFDKTPWHDLPGCEDWDRDKAVYAAQNGAVLYAKPDTPEVKAHNQAERRRWETEQATRDAKRKAQRRKVDGDELERRARDRLDGIAGHLRVTPYGYRCDMLNWASFKTGLMVRDGHLSRNDVHDTLAPAAYSWGDAEMEWVRGRIDHGLDDAEKSGKPVDWDDDWSTELVTLGTESKDSPTRTTKSNPKPKTNDGEPVDFDRRIVGRRLSTVKTRVPDWVWHYEGKGRIQHGTLTMFTGRPGVGKSAAIRHFVAQLTRGTLPGCWHGQPKNVAVMMLEEQTDCIVAPALQAAGADMTRVFEPEAFDGNAASSIMAISDEERLTQWLVDNEISALFVDPVMSTFGRSVDIYRTNEVRDYLAPYTRMAETISGIVVAATHLRKGEIRDILSDINGSSAFGEVPRAVFGFAHIEDGEHIMQQAKNSAGPAGLKLLYKLPMEFVTADDGRTAELPRFEITGPTTLSITDVNLVGDDTDLVMVNADDEWLRRYLEIEQPAPSARVKTDARKQADISESRLHRARKRLKVKVINQSRPGAEHTTAWCLPEEQE